LVLNAVVLPLFIIRVIPFDLGQSLSGLKGSLGSVSVGRVLAFLALLYLVAIAWGLVSGALAGYAPRILAYRLRLTPVSPVPNVFNDMLGALVRTPENLRLRGTPAQAVPWLRLQRPNGAIVGRIARGSVDFDVDAPIEVFLSPTFRITVAGTVPWSALDGAVHQGVYLRVRAEDIVEVFTARADWLPCASQRAEAGQPT
jgi:hypothetical protein